MHPFASSSSAPAHTMGADTYEHALRALEQAHPALDPDSDAFDESVMWRVYERMKALVRMGTPPATAVELAADSQFGA